jgi:hypothetical protein
MLATGAFGTGVDLAGYDAGLEMPQIQVMIVVSSIATTYMLIISGSKY